jgi:DNA-binding transcriptional LysR family regulator
MEAILGSAGHTRKYRIRILLHTCKIWIMELRHLRYFVAVAEELSFTRAAERLHIAQPPLSTQIKALEDELRAPLFEREKRRIHLTPAGRRLLERARAILTSAEEARLEARGAADGDVGHVALAYTASAMLAPQLPAVLRAYQQLKPGVRLQLQELGSLEQLDALHSRAIDIGILRRRDVDTPPGLALEPWQETPLVAAIPAGSPLAARKAVRIADLRDQPLITYPRDAGIGLYWKVQALCGKAGFRPRIVQEARDSATIIGLVAAGVGIAVVPGDTRCIALEGVVYQRLADAEATSTLHLAYRGQANDPHVKALLTRLRAVRAKKR